ncbi:hypothetical protein ATSB10_03450 [Dyella thiooxydans]|uniref:Uncharacterized protein n=1 Tax=Dyella thiooxydans TaxID=445710 RepID=A0A169GNZ5_9GAMM|nr:hypothetical protein ATSB10_03450 [Dyella thiooxydans]
MPAKSHHPLFEVRYELISATPSRRPEPLPQIDMGSAKAAIHPLSLDASGVGRGRRPVP